MVIGKSTKETVKTIAQGMPVDPAPPVVTAACFFVAGGPWVRPSPGITCTLFDFEGGLLEQLGHSVPRGRVSLSQRRHCERQRSNPGPRIDCPCDPGLLRRETLLAKTECVAALFSRSFTASRGESGGPPLLRLRGADIAQERVDVGPQPLGFAAQRLRCVEHLV